MSHHFRHRICRLVMAALLGVAALPTAALAQEAPQEATPLPRGAISFGAFWFKPGVQIPEMGIDTNVFNKAGERDPDFVVTIQPSLDLGITTRRFDLTVTPRLAVVHFRNAASERSRNGDIAAKTERRFSSHVAAYADGSMGYYRDRIGVEVDARARRYSQNLTVGTRLTGRRLTMDVHASDSTYQYHPDAQFQDVPLARELNRVSRSAGIDTGYRLSSFTTSSVNVEVAADRFTRTPERSTDSIQVSAGLDFKPRALIKGNVRGGYRYARTLRGTAPDFSGVTAAGGLTFTWRDSFSMSGGLARDLDFSYRPDRPYFVYDLFEGSVRQAFLSRLDFGVGMSYTMLNYRSYIDAMSPQGDGLQTRLRNRSASLGIRVVSGVRLGVYAARWERCCSAGWSKSDRVGVQFSVGGIQATDRGVFMPGPGL